MTTSNVYYKHFPEGIFKLCVDKKLLNEEPQKRYVTKDDTQGNLNYYTVRVGKHQDGLKFYPFVEREFHYNNDTTIKIASLFKDKKVMVDSCSDNKGYNNFFWYSEFPLPDMKEIEKITLDTISQSISDISDTRFSINHFMPQQ